MRGRRRKRGRQVKNMNIHVEKVEAEDRNTGNLELLTSTRNFRRPETHLQVSHGGNDTVMCP